MCVERHSLQLILHSCAVYEKSTFYLTPWDRFCPSAPLEAEIGSAKQLVKLGDNWDGEGSPGYEQATIDRAASFLRLQFSWLWSKCGIEAPAPRIAPGPDGSIDLLWKRQEWRLLINVPADPSEAASYYGDDFGSQKTNGHLETGSHSVGIAPWLMRDSGM
jgi:hypothetical protein